ncbi:MAG: DUF971 domain-containing protein [Polyangiaceae bacterium]
MRSPRGARVTEIDWADGGPGHLPAQILRGFCPCAGCQGHSGEIRSSTWTASPSSSRRSRRSAKSYALALKWFDGHSTGIYSYRYLRSLCHYDACKAERDGERAPG